VTGPSTPARRRQAARAWAQWNLGDPAWADDVLAAWADPEATLEQLRAEGWQGPD
jgi:hypothetical protein